MSNLRRMKREGFPAKDVFEESGIKGRGLTETPDGHPENFIIFLLLLELSLRRFN